MTALCDLSGAELAGDPRRARSRPSSSSRPRSPASARSTTGQGVPPGHRRGGSSARPTRGQPHRRRGGTRPVAGIPLALKDVLSTKGITTTCGSQILENYVPPYDCTAWARLRAAGRPDGQDELRRVRHGVVQRELGVRPGPQPVGPGARPRRLCGGIAAAVAAGEAVGRSAPTPAARSASRLALRRGRVEADVRPAPGTA